MNCVAVCCARACRYVLRRKEGRRGDGTTRKSEGFVLSAPKKKKGGEPKTERQEESAKEEKSSAFLERIKHHVHKTGTLKRTMRKFLCVSIIECTHEGQIFTQVSACVSRAVRRVYLPVVESFLSFC